jgi:hypothetical protein
MNPIHTLHHAMTGSSAWPHESFASSWWTVESDTAQYWTYDIIYYIINCNCFHIHIYIYLKNTSYSADWPLQLIPPLAI